MTRKVIYKCDICGDELHIEKILAVRFKSSERGNFQLLSYLSNKFNETDHHICIECAKGVQREMQGRYGLDTTSEICAQP